MRIDFHTHVLPAVDDGAAHIVEAMEILAQLKMDGIDVVVATPHLYSERDTVNTLIKRRDKSFKTLTDVIEASGAESPEIINGAEVYFEGLKPDWDLSPLCIGDTDFILLELPYYRALDDQLIHELQEFISSHPFKIIFAHIERYFRFSDKDMVLKALACGHYGQVNCDSFLSKYSRPAALELIEKGLVHVIGSDVHNMVSRPPFFKEAEFIIRRKLGNRVFNKMMETSREILGLQI